MTVTREEVVYAYRLILGREPENEAVVEEAMGAADLGELRRNFLGSAEFAESRELPIGRFLTAAPVVTDIDCTEEQRRAMFDRIGRAWKAFGEQDPHWSVVTDDAFRQQQIAATLDRFYKGGHRAIDSCLNYVRRAALPTRFAKVMDFGCGVGRLSLALAPFAEQVIGVDISPPHLQLAKDRAAKEGVANVAFEAIAAIDDLDRYRGFDFVISMIVLQHNPPPMMAVLYAKLLASLAPGGLALVQMPTYIDGQAFSAADYLANDGMEMEMHALAQREIFRVIDEAGCRTIEVREDGAAGRGPALSHTFLVQRQA